MTENNKTDQWLSDGKCLECRRQDYCKKPCTRAKRRAKAILAQMQKGNSAIKGAGEKMRE